MIRVVPVAPRPGAGAAALVRPAATHASWGYAYIIGAALLWATIGPAARFALRAGVQPLEISFWRAAIGGLLFALHAVVRGRLRIARQDLPAVGGFALLGVTIFYWSYFRAVQLGGAALAAILLYTAPAWVALAAALWLGERLTMRKSLRRRVTLAGIALVALGSGSSDLRNASHSATRATALGWGLLSGLAYAAYYLFGKRYFARYEASTLFAYALPLGAAMLLPAVTFAPKSGGGLARAALPGRRADVRRVPPLQHRPRAGGGDARRHRGDAGAGGRGALAYAVWGEALRGLGYAGAALVLAGVLLVATERGVRGAVDPPHEGPAPTT